MKKILLFLSLMFLSTIIVSAQVEADANITNIDNNDEQIYEKPDKIAQFPGGMDAYVTWMSANFHYPEKAIRNNVEGRVVLSFVVNKQGRIKDIKVLHSLSPECDKEAIRMVKAMPRWFAAEHQGRKVNCRYTMPVVFKLNK